MKYTAFAAALALGSALGVAPAFAQETEGGAHQPAAEETETNASTPDREQSKQCEGDFCVRDLFVGVGLGVAFDLGGLRSGDVEAVETPDGLFVQIDKSQETDIRVLFETHYLMEGQTIFASDGGFAGWGEALPSLAACGPFALVRNPDVNRRGCGPFFTVAIETNGEVSQFGAGWFIGFGGSEARERAEERNPGFGVGVGFIVNPEAQTIDGRVVDTETMLVRPAFEAAVEAGTLSLTTRETTVGALIMISKDF